MKGFIVFFASTLLFVSAIGALIGYVVPESSISRLVSGHVPVESCFARANTTNDGRLTLAQAVVAMPVVANHFTEIDAQNRGYVTLDQVEEFVLDERVFRR
jgi:hypothetical protein